MSLEKALDIGKRTGWRVFPVGLSAKSGGKTEKRPLCKWTSEASADPERIRALWRRSPGAAVGVATGKESGLYVVDVDDPEAIDPDGDIRFGIPMPTSRPGGMHYYFGSPRDGKPVKNSAEGGLDFRGDGGFVVMWSELWGIERLLQPLPDSIADWARNRSRVTAAEVSAAGETIPEGSRESTLVSMAGTMHRRGFCLDAIRAAVWLQNVAACVPQLDEEDCERIAASVTRYARDELDVSSVVAALRKT